MRFAPYQWLFPVTKVDKLGAFIPLAGALAFLFSEGWGACPLFSLKFWNDFLRSYGNQIYSKNALFWAPTHLIWRRIDGVVVNMIFGVSDTFGCILLEWLQVYIQFILCMEALSICFLLTPGLTRMLRSLSRMMIFSVFTFLTPFHVNLRNAPTHACGVTCIWKPFP